MKQAKTAIPMLKDNVPSSTGRNLLTAINDFLNDSFPIVVEDFKELKPKERARLFCELLQYSLPKKQSAKPEPEKTTFKVTIKEFIDNG